MKDKWRSIERELRAQGWVMETTSNGHVKCRPPDPTKPIVITSGDSGDPRAPQQMIRDLKRSGYVPGQNAPTPMGSSPSTRNAAVSRVEQAPASDESFAWDDDFQEMRAKMRVISLYGALLKRVDRTDPRDPKMIVSFDKKFIHLRDCNNKRLRIHGRDFARDIRKEKYAMFDLEREPDLSRLPFDEALVISRMRANLSVADVGELLSSGGQARPAGCGDEMIAAAERPGANPSRRLRDALIAVFPALGTIQPPDHVLRLKPSSKATPTPPSSISLSTPTMENYIELIWEIAGGELVKSLVIRRPVDYRKGKSWMCTLHREGDAKPLDSVGDSPSGAAREMVMLLSHGIEQQEKTLREQARALAEQEEKLRNLREEIQSMVNHGSTS